MPQSRGKSQRLIAETLRFTCDHSKPRRERFLIIGRATSLKGRATSLPLVCWSREAIYWSCWPSWHSLTYEHGKEMASYGELTANTEIKVYFCDPKSPWQQGSYENINDLIRQYLARALTSRQSAKMGSMGLLISSTADLVLFTDFTHLLACSR